MASDLIAVLNASGVTPLVPVIPAPAGTPALGSSLFQAPGSYNFNGNAWPMTAEGLCIIAGLSDYDAGYRITFQSNVLELMRALGFLTQYGARDSALTPDATPQTGCLWMMRERKIGRQCGQTDAIVANACASLGIPHRTVQLLTAETPNGYDDGHVISEVEVNGAWQLFDVDTKAIFLDVNGNQQNLAQVIAAGVANLTTEELTQLDCDQQPYSNSEFPFSVYFAMTLLTPALRATWRQRIYQIPGIVQSNGVTLCYMPAGTESRQAWVESFGFQVTDQTTWMNTFYPS